MAGQANLESPVEGSGTLILIVGPSGAGKDTLIGKAKEHFRSADHIYFPQRFITRTEAVGEDHIPVSSSDFQAMARKGFFFLHWRAHKLNYALPADILNHLEKGNTVVVNISRRAIRRAHEQWTKIFVLHITAERAVLEKRLVKRQREKKNQSMYG